MLDFNSSVLSTRITHLIDTAMTADRWKPTRFYLGGAQLGEECLRKLQFSYFHSEVDEGRDLDGRKLRIFHRGNQGEEWMAGWLRGAGFELDTVGADGKQIGFRQAEGRIAGRGDGKFVGGPAGFNYPALWEHKTLGGKGWNKLNKDRLYKAYPEYYAQVQIYMAYLDLSEHPGIFTALNADTMDIYAEAVPFDAKAAQAISDKAVNVLQACDAGVMLPGISTDPSFFKCKFCDWARRCHFGEVPNPEPATRHQAMLDEAFSRHEDPVASALLGMDDVPF